jgi:hypothetical protein
MFNTICTRAFRAHAALIVALAVAGHATPGFGQPAAPFAQHLLDRNALPAPAAYHPRTEELFVAVKGDVKMMKPGDSARPLQRHDVYSNPHGTILRIRLDPVRERLWILDVGAVHVFDLARKRLVRSVRLVNWSYIGYGFNCLPDLQLDSSGAAFVSDNSQPRLWRIDSDSFSVREHTVGFDSMPALDSGFSALAMTEGGVMFGAMAASGLLWRIDTASFRAERIPLSTPVRGACGIEALNAAQSRDSTLFVLSALPAAFEIQRIAIPRNAGGAAISPVTVDAIPAPAGLLARNGAPYFATIDAALPASRRRHPGAFSLRPVSVRE